MKILSNRFDLEFGDGENMTVTVINTENVADGVNYAFNAGKPSETVVTQPLRNPFERTLPLTPPDAVPSPSYLTVTLHYPANKGGRCQVRVSGNYGGPTSEYDCKQQDGDPNQQLNYKLTIRPNGGRL